MLLQNSRELESANQKVFYIFFNLKTFCQSYKFQSQRNADPIYKICSRRTSTSHLSAILMFASWTWKANKQPHPLSVQHPLDLLDGQIASGNGWKRQASKIKRELNRRFLHGAIKLNEESLGEKLWHKFVDNTEGRRRKIVSRFWNQIFHFNLAWKK